VEDPSGYKIELIQVETLMSAAEEKAEKEIMATA
jgi:hypothetical protein